MEITELGGRLMMVNNLRRTLLHAKLPEGGLQHGQLPVLATVIRQPDCTQAALAEQLRVSPASIALSTKRLEKAGLIERRVNPDNRRCNRLRATEAGARTAAICLEGFASVDERSFMGFSDAEKAQLAAYFDRMIQNLTGSEKVELFSFFQERRAR